MDEPRLRAPRKTHVPIVQSELVRQEWFQADYPGTILELQEQERQSIVECWSKRIVVDKLRSGALIVSNRRMAQESRAKSEKEARPTHDEVGLLQPLDDIRISAEIALDRLALFVPPEGPHLPPLLHFDDLRTGESGRIGHVFAPDTG